MVMVQLNLERIDTINKVLQNYLNIDKKSIEKYLIPRIKIFKDSSKYFFIEKYTEREWKELVKLHYIHTTYSLSNEVYRVHFFTRDSVENDSYLGFVTLRNLPEPKVCLSFVYPNFDVLIPYFKKQNSLSDASLYIMSYEKKVHICHYELVIRTFPFFAQDGVVTRCAHADIIMVAKFLNKKWGFNEVTINDVINSYSFYPTKRFPSEGLLIFQIVEIFANNGIDVSIKAYMQFQDLFREILDATIESCLPAILAIEGHVIVFLGYILSSKGERKYIIYDDSGYFTSLINYGNSHFLSIASWSSIENHLTEESFLIYPDLDRVFFPYPNLREAYNSYLSQLELEELSKNFRALIVDNSTFKSFLVKNNNDIVFGEKDLADFLEKNLPHFLWYIETKVKDVFLICAADTTKHVFTMHNPFYPFLVASSVPLNLLAKF